MVSLSNFIIGLVVASLVISVFGVFISTGTTNYNVNWDNSSLDSYKQLESLHNQTKDIEDETTEADQKEGIIDVIGSYITNAFKSLKISYKSIKIFHTMTDAAIDDSNMGESSQDFKNAIILIVMITLLIGVIASALLKYRV